MRRFILWLICCAAFYGFAFAQDNPPDVEPIYSIFDYDTCAPPCWMGLIPGESTVEDVETVLYGHPELVVQEAITVGYSYLPSGARDRNPTTGLVENGGYYFYIQEINPILGHASSRVDIEQGIVDLIVVQAHEAISLQITLQKIGEPSSIHFTTAGTIVWFVIIYPEPRLRINLTVSMENCQTNMLDKFSVDSVLYFSPDAAVRLVTFDYDIPQYNLTSYRLLDGRNVPLDLWQSWLDGEVDMSCEEAWALLPEPEVTPVVEVTVEPESTEESR